MDISIKIIRIKCKNCGGQGKFRPDLDWYNDTNDIMHHINTSNICPSCNGKGYIDFKGDYKINE